MSHSQKQNWKFCNQIHVSSEAGWTKGGNSRMKRFRAISICALGIELKASSSIKSLFDRSSLHFIHKYLVNWLHRIERFSNSSNVIRSRKRDPVKSPLWLSTFLLPLLLCGSYLTSQKRVRRPSWRWKSIEAFVYCEIHPEDPRRP